MPPKKEGYKNLSERAAAGDYDLILPFDLYVLAALPKEGELFGGLYPIGKTAFDLRDEERFKDVQISQLTARLSALRIQGLVVKVRTLGSVRGNAFQVSKNGQKQLKKLGTPQEESSGQTE